MYSWTVNVLLLFRGLVSKLFRLEGTAHCAGLLLASAESCGQGFFALLGKRRDFYTVCAYSRPFLCSIGNSVMCISIQKKYKKCQKIKQTKYRQSQQKIMRKKNPEKSTEH